MNTYSVCRNCSKFEYASVNAESEEEAIELAKELDEDEWEMNPNEEYWGTMYEYGAELEEENVEDNGEDD